MRYEYKTVTIKTNKDFEKAEKLHKSGWKHSKTGIEKLMFYRPIKTKKNPSSKKRVRFYTDTDKYMGYVYYSRDIKLEIDSWLYSGNKIKIGKKTFDKKGEIKK